MNNINPPQNLIKRKIFNDILRHLNNPEITLIVGPRQVGKTTIMYLLAKMLIQQNQKIVYLNLDLEEDFARISSQINFINYLNLHLGQKKGYVFIDEIQRLPNAGLFLKGLYDRNLPYKFIISGSGSLELKEKISESLMGRKRIFHIYPISFTEFIDFKTNYQFTNNLSEYFATLTQNEQESLLKEYMWFGGYPKVIKASTLKDKQLYLTDILESFIDKDIKELLNIKNSTGLLDLLSILSIQIGRLIPINHIIETTGISFNTIKRYIYYLEKTFIIDKVQPFYTNPTKELLKSPIYYFIDLGLRNYIFNRLNFFDAINSGPMLFQNFIYITLKNLYTFSQIRFWRTKGGAEIDFILKIGASIIPIEVKYKHLKKPTIGKSVISFIKTYSPKNLFIVNLSYTDIRIVDNTKVIFIPYYKLMDEKVLNAV